MDRKFLALLNEREKFTISCLYLEQRPMMCLGVCKTRYSKKGENNKKGKIQSKSKRREPKPIIACPIDSAYGGPNGARTGPRFLEGPEFFQLECSSQALFTSASATLSRRSSFCVGCNEVFSSK